MRAGLFACALALAAVAPAPASPLKEGKPAPNFVIRTLDGQTVRLADLRGQVVVLNFWATWCAPCKSELPLLDAYYRKRRDVGLRAFAITTEDSVPLSQLKALTSAMAIPAVKGIRGPYAPLGAVPTNFVIDRAGVLRYAQAGAFDLDTLNRLLVPLLREPAPAPAAS